MQFCNHCCSVAQFSFNMTVITGILIFIPAHCVFVCVCVWGGGGGYTFFTLSVRLSLCPKCLWFPLKNFSFNDPILLKFI